MKKIVFLILGLISVFALKAQIYSSKISPIKPTLVVWEVNGERITIKDAKNGLPTPDQITLEVYIDTSVVKRHKQMSFDVKWFYYLSTRRKLMGTKTITLKEAQKDGDAYIFKATFNNLTKGWWEAQIISKADRGLLKFGNLTRYQIFLK